MKCAYHLKFKWRKFVECSDDAFSFDVEVEQEGRQDLSKGSVVQCRIINSGT